MWWDVRANKREGGKVVVKVSYGFLIEHPTYTLYKKTPIQKKQYMIPSKPCTASEITSLPILLIFTYEINVVSFYLIQHFFFEF